MSRITQAVLFAYIVAFVDWEAIRGVPFRDIENYVNRIENIQKFGDYYVVLDNTIAGWISFEILWFKTLEFSTTMGIDPILFLKYITFISSFLTFLFVKKNFNSLLCWIILLNPVTIDLLSAQVRSAFAFSIFLTAISWDRGSVQKYIQIALIAVTPFIHSAMSVIIVLYLVSIFFQKINFVDFRIKHALLFFGMLFLSLAMAMYSSSVLEAVGDRRQLEGIGLKSQAYMIFWYVLIFLLAMPSLWRRIDWKIYFSMSLITVGSVLNLFGVAGFRFVALSIPIFFAAIPLAKANTRIAIILMTIAYDALLFAYWFK